MKKKSFYVILWSCLGLLFSCSQDATDDDSTTPETVTVDRSANLLAAGASANDILSNVSSDRLLIEIGFVGGFNPTQESVDNFVNYLRERTFKQDIDVSFLSLPSPEEDTLTLQEVVDLEDENRTAFSNGNTLAVYIYFADAPSEDDDEGSGKVTLGAVYRNTSMVIYESTIRRFSSRSPLITTTDVETATLNHEFGHLFGLVNLGTPTVNDHESQSENENGELVGNNHCNVDGCLMQAQLQFGGPLATRGTSKNVNGNIRSACNLSGESVLHMLETAAARGSANAPVLDDECILDLQANGGR